MMAWHSLIPVITLPVIVRRGIDDDHDGDNDDSHDNVDDGDKHQQWIDRAMDSNNTIYYHITILRYDN
jgi:hypothetical protein